MMSYQENATFVRVKVTILNQYHEAEVRSDMTIRQLIKEIQREFHSELMNDKEFANSKEDGYLWREKGVMPLDESRSIDSLKISPNTRLVFGTRKQAPRRKAIPMPDDWIENEPTNRLDHAGVSLYDAKAKRTLAWDAVPAIIGRKGSKGYERVREILIDERFHQHVIEYVSRDHAAMIHRDDCYYIVPLKKDRPVILNGTELKPNIAYPLEHNDEIVFKESNILLLFYQE